MDNNNKKNFRKSATLTAALGIVAMTYSCSTSNISDAGRCVYGPPPSQFEQNDSNGMPMILDSDTIAAPDTIKNQENGAPGSTGTAPAQETKKRKVCTYKDRIEGRPANKDRIEGRPAKVYGPPPKKKK